MGLSPTELLRAPFALPARALENLEAVADTARELPATLGAALVELATLTALVRELHERVAGLDVRVAVLERSTARLPSSLTALDRRLTLLDPLRSDVAAVRADVHAALELLPDPNAEEPGPLERVRTALVGGDGGAAS